MTCGCEIVYVSAGSTEFDYVRYCPQHDGSTEKRLRESVHGPIAIHP